MLNGASSAEIKSEAIRSGMMTLRRSALNKLLEVVMNPNKTVMLTTFTDADHAGCMESRKSFMCGTVYIETEDEFGEVVRAHD